MKVKKLYFVIELAVFPFSILFSFDTIEGTKQKCKKILPKEVFKDIEDLFQITDTDAARTIHLTTGSTIVWFNESDLSHGRIAHEIFHAVDFILDRIGVNDKETYAYCIQYVTDRVYRNIEYYDVIRTVI